MHSLHGNAHFTYLQMSFDFEIHVTTQWVVGCNASNGALTIWSTFKNLRLDVIRSWDLTWSGFETWLYAAKQHPASHTLLSLTCWRRASIVPSSEESQQQQPIEDGREPAGWLLCWVAAMVADGHAEWLEASSTTRTLTTLALHSYTAQIYKWNSPRKCILDRYDSLICTRANRLWPALNLPPKPYRLFG